MAPPPFREPLDVFIAHTGKRIVADRVWPGFDSVEAFKRWIASRSGIEEANVLLMTPQGKPPKIESIMKEEDEMFLFDMGLFTLSDSDSGDIPQLEEPDPYITPSFPPNIAEGSSPKAWERLFRKRSNWARELANETADVSHLVLKLNTEIGIVQRSCTIAVQGVKTHLEKNKSNYEDVLDGARDNEQEQSYVLFHCTEYLDKLSNITAIPEVGSCLRSTKLDAMLMNASGSRARITLQDFVNLDEVKKASDTGAVSSNRFGNRINTMAEDFNAMIQIAEDISARFHQDVIEACPNVEPQIGQISTEITTLLEKIQRDHRRIESMPNLYNASEMAAAQSTNSLPSLVMAVTKVHQLLGQLTQRKNQITRAAIKYMQKVSIFETKAAAVRQQSIGLDIDDGSREALILVDFIVQLPSVYGSLLVECYRRNEWSQKHAIRSSSSSEEKTDLSSEEQKRRVSWAQIVGDFVNPDVLNDMAIKSDIHDSDWPKVTKDDIDRYFDDIQKLEGLDKEIREFEKQLKSLDKGRSRKAKGFKNGSLRDAAAVGEPVQPNDGLISGSPYVHSRSLEERLKNSESRNARLEIMLQRQEMEHQSKLTDGTAFGNPLAPGSKQQRSKRAADYSTKPVMPKDISFGPFPQSSPRVLSELIREQGGSAKQIRDDEVENSSLSEQLATANKALKAKTEVNKILQKQAEEAVSIKHGLLKDLESRQRDSAEERRTLEAEKSNLKAKLEEAEGVGRAVKNRDMESKTKELELEIDKTRKDAEAEVQKAQGQIDFLQSDYTKYREKVSQLEQRLQQISEEKADLEIKLAAATHDIQGLKESKEKHFKALQAALQCLTTDASIPAEYDALVAAVESNAQKSLSQLAATNDALEEVEVDRGRLKTTVEKLEERLASKKETLEAHEKSMKEGAIAKALSSDLTNTLQTCNNQLEELIADKTKMSKRLGTHADRAVEITSRLHAHVTGLLQILDQAGFAVAVEDGKMTIQKAPRAVADSTLFNEASTTDNNGKAPAESPIKSILDAFADEAVLTWATQQDSDVEIRQFDKFLQTVDTFDIGIIGEVIVKRLREAEYTTRRWHREARNYRERMHRAQSDARDKIAYRAFKPGDLALFLPTRGQVARSWAAFNVGAPHYFLREQDSHHLETRDWLLARISKVDERVVDLSKTIIGLKPSPDTRSIGETSEGGASIDDDNPFELSDGLRWYLLDAAEEKPGAPNLLGPSKTTVASAKVDAKGSIRVKTSPDGEGATKTLTRSLDSRRSSTNSKKSIPAVSNNPATTTLTSEHGSVSSTLTAPPRDLSKQVSNPQSEPLDGRQADDNKPLATSPIKSISGKGWGASSLKKSPEEAHSEAWDSLLSFNVNLESGKGK